MPTRKKYYALSDTFGFPIPGTMFGSDTYINTPYHVHLPECSDLENHPENDIIDLSKIERFHHPSGLRYFYKVECFNGPIIPNSLIAVMKHPGPGYVEIINVKCCDE